MNHCRKRIPFWLKIVYTLFVCVTVPTYWKAYGPANFLSFCDVGLLLTCLGLWMESPLLISVNAVALMLPQTAWICDFVSGGRLLGITRYMFNPVLPIVTRTISTFHIWLPILLLLLISRVGYDRRAVWMQTLIIAMVLIASYLLTDPRHPPAGYPAPAVNLNRVYGIDDTSVQTAMPPLLYLATEFALIVLCFYLPAHLILRRVFPQANGIPALQSDRGS